MIFTWARQKYSNTSTHSEYCMQYAIILLYELTTMIKVKRTYFPLEEEEEEDN